ncbi:MAG: rhodanese-like domain-containing protein [Phycisphaerae bacterium]|nr:rhodanese-like domain-containing protein [Phycisphaerae bacterium]
MPACTAGPNGCPSTTELDAQQSSALIVANQSNRDFVILDVRTPAEFAAERIEGAVNIDVETDTQVFTSEVSKLDPTRKYLIYCRSGRRSCIAGGIMESLGFTDLSHLEGGINAWKAAGLPADN